MSEPNIFVIPGETRTEYVTRTVHEHRAPTDASVKLLTEMEAATLAKIEHSINVGGNGFECVVNIMRRAMDMDTVAVAIFKLNGNQMRAEARVEGWKSDDVEKLPVELRDAIAKEIANQAIGPALRAARWPPKF